MDVFKGLIPIYKVAQRRMNWEAIGAIGEVVGALGVIVSLIYLATQIRRSDQTARAESIRSVLDGYRERSVVHSFTNPDVPDLFAKGLTDFDTLDASEKRRFFYLFAENIFQVQQAMELHQSGLLPKIDYEAWLYYTATLVQTPGGKKVWPHIAVTITPTIRDVIDRFLVANPETPSYIDLNPLLNFDEGAA